MPSDKFLNDLARALNEEDNEEVHPDVDDLANWLAGSCNEEEAKDIADHVSGCEMCMAVVREAEADYADDCTPIRSAVLVSNHSTLVAIFQVVDETYSARHLELERVYDADTREEALAGVITQALLYAEYVMSLPPERLSQVTARHRAYLEAHGGLTAWQDELRSFAAANGLQLEGGSESPKTAE